MSRNFGIPGREYRTEDYRIPRARMVQGPLDKPAPPLVPLWHDMACLVIWAALGLAMWFVLLWVWP